MAATRIFIEMSSKKVSQAFDFYIFSASY